MKNIFLKISLIILAIFFCSSSYTISEKEVFEKSPYIIEGVLIKSINIRNKEGMYITSSIIRITKVLRGEKNIINGTIEIFTEGDIEKYNEDSLYHTKEYQENVKSGKIRQLICKSTAGYLLPYPCGIYFCQQADNNIFNRSFKYNFDNKFKLTLFSQIGYYGEGGIQRQNKEYNPIDKSFGGVGKVCYSLKEVYDFMLTHDNIKIPKNKDSIYIYNYFSKIDSIDENKYHFKERRNEFIQDSILNNRILEENRRK